MVLHVPGSPSRRDADLGGEKKVGIGIRDPAANLEAPIGAAGIQGYFRQEEPWC